MLGRYRVQVLPSAPFVNNLVLVVGAGLAGLSTALQLARAGFHVDVVERLDAEAYRTHQSRSAACVFPPHGARALHILGILDAIIGVRGPAAEESTARGPGVPPSPGGGVDVVRHSYDLGEFTERAVDGDVLGTADLKKLWLAEQTLPFFSCKRALVHRLLLEALLHEGVHIRFGTWIERVAEEDERGVFVEFNAGAARRTFDAHFSSSCTSEAYSLVVGADGMWSQVRAMAFPKVLSKQRATAAAGHPWLYSFVLPWRALSAGLVGYNLWVDRFKSGRVLALVVIPVSDDETLFCALLPPRLERGKADKDGGEGEGEGAAETGKTVDVGGAAEEGGAVGGAARVRIGSGDTPGSNDDNDDNDKNNDDGNVRESKGGNDEGVADSGMDDGESKGGNMGDAEGSSIEDSESKRGSTEEARVGGNMPTSAAPPRTRGARPAASTAPGPTYRPRPPLDPSSPDVCRLLSAELKHFGFVDEGVKLLATAEPACVIATPLIDITPDTFHDPRTGRTSWASGRLLVVGSAAHASSPIHMGGAETDAFEDAIALASVFKTNGGISEASLALYSRRRQRRVRHTQKEARRQGAPLKARRFAGARRVLGCFSGGMRDKQADVDQAFRYLCEYTC